MKEHQYFKHHFSKEIDKFLKPGTLVVKSIITRSKIVEGLLDNEPSNIHFLNGYWSFDDHAFHARTNVHYITDVIDYELQEELQYNHPLLLGVREVLQIPFSSSEAFDYFIHSMALCMLKIPTSSFFVFLGSGGNGKTTFTTILRAVFQKYCVSLPSATLDSTSEANKSVAGIHGDTLFVFIDEIKAKAVKKSSLLKKLSDGYLMYNKLYQSGSFELSTRAKLIINSNSPLAFDDDDDAIRNRILYVKFNKRFTKVPEEVDNMTIFPAATLLHSTLTATQKSSIFLYFAMIAKGLDAAVTVPVPEDILTKDRLINWKDFVNRHFTLNKNAFVSRDLVFQLFKDTYPDFEYTSREIIKGLSELPAEFNVIYKKGKQIQCERGCFYGLYSMLESENFQPARDLAYEEELMALDSSAGGLSSAVVDVTLTFTDMCVDFD